MNENQARDAAFERRLRREAKSLPGPPADLSARIMDAVNASPAPTAARPSPWPRPAFLGALATAAGILLWLGLGRRAEEGGADLGPSAVLTHAAPLLGFGDQATQASSGHLRAWVDEPLLREVEQWVESGNRAAQRYVSLVPLAMRSAETREG